MGAGPSTPKRKAKSVIPESEKKAHNKYEKIYNIMNNYDHIQDLTRNVVLKDKKQIMKIVSQMVNDGFNIPTVLIDDRLEANLMKEF